MPRTNLFVEPRCHGQTCLSVWCYRQRSNARQAKRTFEFNRAFPCPNSRTPSNLSEADRGLVLCWVPRTNLFVRVVRSPVIECPENEENAVDQTSLVTT